MKLSVFLLGATLVCVQAQPVREARQAQTRFFNPFGLLGGLLGGGGNGFNQGGFGGFNQGGLGGFNQGFGGFGGGGGLFGQPISGGGFGPFGPLGAFSGANSGATTFTLTSDGGLGRPGVSLAGPTGGFFLRNRNQG